MKKKLIVLEEEQIRWVKLMALRNFMSDSSYLRLLIEEDMERNMEIQEKYKDMLFAKE